MYCNYDLFRTLQAKQKETATFKWEMVQNAMTTLNVSEEEAKGIWSLIVAIYHLGYAGVRKGLMPFIPQHISNATPYI